MNPGQFITLIFLGCCLNLNAQQFGGNPPSILWKQIHAPGARIIFPDGLERQGQRVAQIVGVLHGDTTSSIGSERRTIDIVLQNQTTISNGYVALSPWRSEFYLTPMQNSFELGSLPSTDNLALHEYRHVMQYSNYRKGLSRLMYIIAGQDGQALANAASIPNWFFEGDAVFNETSKSDQGRGRLPLFFNGYRAVWNSDHVYSFMQLRNGSLRRYIPNHYPLGYLLVTYGRMKYGTDFWQKVTDDAARFKGIFYPFQKAVKLYSGIRYKNFVQDAFAFYKQDNYHKPDSSGFISPAEKNNVTNYHFPFAMGKDSLLVLKKSYRQLPAWYILTKAGETKIENRDLAIDDYYSYRNGRLVYAAFESDLRWDWKDYSVIKVLNLVTHEQKQIGRHSKYFSPDISPNGEMVVAVQYNPLQSCNLHLLSTRDGSLIKEIPNPEHWVYTHPKFFNDTTLVAALRDAKGMMAMAFIETHNGLVKTITPFSFRVCGDPFIKGDSILFTISSSETDQLMMYVQGLQTLHSVSSLSNGMYEASIAEDGERVYWSSQTALGNRIACRFMKDLKWESANISDSPQHPLYIGKTAEQDGGNLLERLPGKDLPMSRYRKFTHPLNFHSWRPYYENPDWSFTLYGENILNTFRSELSYVYNQNEKSHQIGYSGTYGAFFPWLNGGLNGIFHRSFIDRQGEVVWNEANANLGLSVPLNFTRNRMYRFLTLAGNIHSVQQYYTSAKDRYTDKHVNYLQFSLSYSSQIQKAVQHIFPRLAWSVYLQNRNAIGGTTANQFLISGSLILPGLALTHNLVLTAAYQRRDTLGEYRYTNNFPFSRGYDALDAPRSWKWSANYHFPIFYPDWGFGQMVYFLRIRANAFYDLGFSRSLRTGKTFNFRSAGGEIYFDTKWWNQQALSFGFRYSYLLDPNIGGAPRSNFWEFILPVGLLQ